MSSGGPALDVARLRAETPGCANRAHFNNAGASLMPAPVIDAMLDHLELEAQIGGYEAAEERRDLLDRFYATLADFIGAEPTEVAFTENATRAFDVTFFALPFAPGDRILVGASDYISHQLAYRKLARERGLSVETIAEDANGRLELDALAALLDERTRLVVVDHIGTNSGTVQPVTEVGGAVLRDTDVLYLVDACQSLGQLPIDVKAIGCDILTSTGRKYLRGPRGTGVLYVRQALLEQLEPAFPDVRGASIDPRGKTDYVRSGRRFETWDYNHAGKLGFDAAVRYATAIGIEAITAAVAELGAALRRALAVVDGITVLDPLDEPSGLATFSTKGISAADARARLWAKRVNLSVSTITDTPTREPPAGRREWLRASAHYFNTYEEIDELAAALATLR